ncbi:DUF2207 family protein [Micromonospora eburnea]|uniref:Predicted membrane protein n=1 Tax=Micromonospora eburnea TaxID=227316 RepID=A0A1C6V9U9_9ACTN|nr:DUF2207 domain-containing protein [Micromonospora eburnea]SCL63109.1 Predicted membrane protein [Micromonospora eburnea]
MNPAVLELGAIGASLALFFGAYALLLSLTKPRHIHPAPPSQDLSEEPPAVASLLGTGWQVTEDAAEATLLDLGARGYLEFRQPDNDPYHTTVHLTGSVPAGLNAYERRIYQRVKDLAMDGVVPLTAMTFRDEKAAKSWWKALRREVIADSRARGLSRRRFGPAIVVLLVAVAAVAAAGITYGFGHWAFRTPDKRGDDLEATIGAAVISFAWLSTVAGRYNGERDTAAGRQAASRWMGVRDWLRGHEAFADLPPSAVGLWDRYLAYGAALGATRTASAVIDMGMGDRTRVWSTFGGTWHRVRVRYPSSGRYGETAPKLVFRGVLLGVIGYFIARYGHVVVDIAMQIDAVSASAFAPFAGLTSALITVAGAVLLLNGCYTVVRTITDLTAPKTVTGQVLWIALWRTQTSSSDDSPPQPITYYLAVDDGTSDRTVAWALPLALAGGCATGDTIQMTVRPWSRRVMAVNVVERGTAHGPQPEVPTDNLVLAAINRHPHGGSAAPAAALARNVTLLQADEVASALHWPSPVTAKPTLGPGGMVEFTAPEGPVLMLLTAHGFLGSMAWRAASQGTPLPGIGEAAFARTGAAVARVGDSTVQVALLPAAAGREAALPGLLKLAVERLVA